ncbi:MAG: MDR/zinc-dependent alcohol dehydrogenase-like family protein [Anaerolineae bacterium]
MNEPWTMNAAVIAEPGKVELVRVPIPEPGPKDVRIRLEGCGVCASNLSPWEGQPWFTYPMEPGQLGHESWGRIDALGAEVQNLRVGDRVTALSNHAYAAYDVAPVDAVVSLPEALAGHPFPGEPLGCAMNIYARSGIAKGQTVAIVGIGFLGALLTQLAGRSGVRVLALSRRPWALEVAKAMGAEEVIPMDDHWRVIDKVRELTGGAFCDQVVEATGKQWPLDLAAELTRERGRLIIAGYHQDGPRQVNMQLWNWRGLDVINAHERDPRVYVAGIRSAVEAVMCGDLDPWSLFTHSFALGDLGQALNMTRDRPDGFLKALIAL